MSNTMTAHEPINYLDSILNEEEKRCEYSHQWRNFTISRSGRFKSKNKHRNAVDGKMFDHTAPGTTSTTSSSAATAAMGTSSAYSTSSSDKDKISSHYGSSTFASSNTKSYQNQTATTKSISSSTSSANARQRDKMETYKSYYETNL